MKNTLSNQMWWVILLLASAVILPTVCLLWFMSQALRNVRMAARSQLNSVCRSEANEAFGPFLEWINTETQKARTALSEKNPYEVYVQMAEEESAFRCKGLFIYDLKAGRLLYPAVWTEMDVVGTPDEIAKAEHLEFAKQDLSAALAVYQHVLGDYADYEQTGIIGQLDPVLYKRSKLAQARITAKQDQLEAAISLCESVQRDPLEDAANWYYYTAANLMILDLLEQQGIAAGKQTERLNARIDNLLSVLRDVRFLSSDQRVMAYNKIMLFAEKYHNLLTANVKNKLGDLKERMQLEHESLMFFLQNNDFLIKPSSQLFEKVAGTDMYTFTLHAGQVWLIKVMDAESIVRHLSREMNVSDAIEYRITNTDNDVIVGPETTEHESFLSFAMSNFFKWTIAFYEADANNNIFEAAARRQTAVYMWTGALVIFFIFLAGAYSIRTVTYQVKMNRLKNDFIATVTHELKTPLASMRLLVDTLLEKRYQDEKTATEYLQMVSCENKRLTHLIDSFLTFSRMERNKQVFDFVPIAPDEIAQAAAESVKTKFTNGNAELKVFIDADVKAVCADKDAMVTVIVNLLDNAYKYTAGDKKIQLKVYKENGFACFAVADNGIGISRRQQKKIFNRFYQVDSRLSRSVEGCGLGLSIVKFIVDAHKGKVEVRSTYGKGSIFTVKIPSA